MNYTCKKCGERKGSANFCPRCGKFDGWFELISTLILLSLAIFLPLPLKAGFWRVVVIILRIVLGIIGALVGIGLLSALIKLLMNPIPRYWRAKNLDQLSNSMSRRNRVERDAAIHALGAIGGEEAVNILLRALSSAKPGAEFYEWDVNEITDTLGKMHAQQAVEPFIAFLGQKAPFARHIINALAEIGGKRALQALIEATKNEETADWAFNALGNMDSDEARQIVKSHKELQEEQKRQAEEEKKRKEQEVRDAEEQAEKNRQAAKEKSLEPYSPEVRGNLRLLESTSIPTRQEALAALEKLGWQPGEDRWGAWYHIARDDYEKCGEIGQAAVEPLTSEINRLDKGLVMMKFAAGFQDTAATVAPAYQHLMIQYALVKAALLTIGTPEALRAVKENQKHL